MTPGTFLFDSKFVFKDGDKGKKIFVVLNDGSTGTYIAAKTTSRGDRFSIQHGCQILDRFPNFYFVKGSCFLDENTWIQLDSFFEFETGKLIQKVLTNEIQRIGVLDCDQSVELLTCVSHSDDLSIKNESVIIETINTMNNGAKDNAAC